MHTKQPYRQDLVSVVMSSYKDPPAVLDRAIDSLLRQDYPTLEVILVLEPGDPNGERVPLKYTDPRLRVFQPGERVGRCGAYNLGIARAGGRFIARMDSDDECLQHRISTQLNFLRANPGVAVVGAAVNLFDRDGNFKGVRLFPAAHEDFLRWLPFINPICHPTVIWDRNQVGEVLFDPEFSRACDDMELWLRLVGQGHRFANLKESLLKYTQPPNYSRNRENWRYMFTARTKHWRLALKYPILVLGLPVSGLLAISPQWLISLFTGRSRFSDWFRSIDNKA